MQGRNAITLRDRFKIEGLNQINDYEYDAYGNRLAVSDSEGNLIIYQKDAESKFKFSSEFKAADSAIWKISWANPKYGDLIGVATFTKKVSVFQLRGSEWHEVAYHSLHDGSVNEVKWAPYYYGLKLFACSSDGNISVLEVRNQAWHSQLFELKEMSISSLAVEKRSLLDDTDNLQKEYPMIATAGKEKTVAVWEYDNKLASYVKLVSYNAHKDGVRNIIWRQPTGIFGYFQLFTCSEDGTVKLLTVKKTGEVKEKTLFTDSHPIVRLSQSMTGSIVIASVQDSNRSVVIRETTNGEWSATQQLTV